MNAGKRDKLVSIERATTVNNRHGGETSTWVSIRKEWAQVFYGKGDERRQAAMEQGAQPATFNMLMNDVTRALTIKDRLNLEGVWNIKGLTPDWPNRGEIEITAVRGS